MLIKNKAIRAFFWILVSWCLCVFVVRSFFRSLLDAIRFQTVLSRREARRKLAANLKMFAVIDLAPAPESILSFKCTPEVFADLVEREGIMPAHYVGRYHWVSLERLDAVSPKELKALIGQSYNIVFEKLPKKVRGQLETE
jgi:predicted DNA-binding protein (MmcQ/YjbR family)